MHAVLALLARHVFKVYVAHRRQEPAAANLVVLIVEVDFEHRLAALSHGDVACIDVLHYASAARVGLDAYHAVEVWAVHYVVFGKHIAASAGYLAAYHHAAVAVLHLAVAHNDVLARAVPQAPVVVSAALDGYAVVAGVEEAVFYQHAVARLGVASVAVGAIVVDVHAAYGDVFRQQRVNHPERRAQQSDVFYEYAVALVEVYQLRAQAVFRPEAALVHVDTVFRHLQQPGAAAVALAYHTFLPAVVGGSAPLPPRLVCAAAVDGSLAGDGHVGSLVCVDAG